MSDCFHAAFLALAIERATLFDDVSFLTTTNRKCEYLLPLLVQKICQERFRLCFANAWRLANVSVMLMARRRMRIFIPVRAFAKDEMLER